MSLNTVIIADDDSDDRFLIGEALRIVADIGRIIEVSDGRSLMDLLNRQEVGAELLLVDVNMPMVGGLEALRCIKDSGILADVPKVAISGDKDNLEEAVRIGVDAFYSKPSTLDGYLEIARDIKKHYLP